MGIIKKAFLGKIVSSFLKQKNNYHNGESPRGSMLGTIANEAPFMLLAIFAVIMYAILGLYEALFNSPLGEWIASAWNSILNTSPQSIMAMPSRIPSEESLMQRTVGEWLGFVPPLVADIIYIILAPLASILGIIIVLLAIAVRLGRHILGLFLSANLGKSSANTISWIILAFSILPLLIKHL